MKLNNLLEMAGKSRMGMLLLCSLALDLTSLHAQTNVLKIEYEWSDSLNGKWDKPPDGHVWPDGSLMTVASDPKKFYRLHVRTVDVGTAEVPIVPLAQLPTGPTGPVAIAEGHLRWLIESRSGDGREDSEEQPWANARLGPLAFKVFDYAYQNGTNPAFIEFKVISDLKPPGGPVEFLGDNETPPVRNLGHILVSLNENEDPVPEFSEEGETPCEQLFRRLGNLSNLKIMRFGPTFAAVENERGDLMANAGADPFKVPHDFLKRNDRTFKGDFDSETAKEPPTNGYGGPRLEAMPYENYDAFKKDYLENPVYQELRRRKALRVAGEWALLRGETLPQPELINVNIRQRVSILKGQTVLRFFLDDDEGEDAPLAVINVDAANGGLTITGGRAGSAPLTVQTSAGVQHFELIVAGAAIALKGDVSAAGGFVVGWQTPQVWSIAGGYGATPRYKQTSDDDWCPKVGCGPVAWAILLAHWDRERNVPAAFYRNMPGDFTISDAPEKVSDKPAHMKAVYSMLHDLCDVICNPTGSAGATPPGDMIEAGATYLWFPKTLGYISYSYDWAWDLMDPDWNEPSNRIRTSIKNGRPAIVGLGWLWHYGVAYKYRYQEFKTAPNYVMFKRRWFACNEGWGKSEGAYYSGGDTFLGASIKPKQQSPFN